MAADLRRVLHDTISALTLRPAQIRHIEGHDGAWTIAMVMLCVGMTASARLEFGELGWAPAMTVSAATAALLAFWSRMDAESLQRSYVIALIGGSMAVTEALLNGSAGQTGITPVSIALSAWVLVAWIVYIAHRLRMER